MWAEVRAFTFGGLGRVGVCPTRYLFPPLNAERTSTLFFVPDVVQEQAGDGSVFRDWTRINGYILVLDDEPVVRETLARFLERRGYRVREARTATEALDAITPALRAAILDVLLVNSGGKSGLDVLQAIRRQPELAHVPVLMFTGFGLSPETVKTIEEHGTELLHKPLSFSILADWLETHLSQ